VPTTSNPPKYTLVLPRNGGEETLESGQSVVVLGANGAGKTRLGAWMDTSSSLKDKTHRISAQKVLSMPDSTTPKSINLAENLLLRGYENAESPRDRRNTHKYHYRWQGNPAVYLLNDFEALMTYLFSSHIEENQKYVTEQKNNTLRIEPPKTKLDLVKEVWESILPHRKLILGGLNIQTCPADSPSSLYKSSDMSDGERVIFYLIGQCVSAPENGVLLIDEPEIHLHKSIQVPLWNAIEKLRRDCLFVYLTHDVDFAVAKEDAKRIWLKSFDGKTWDWEEIEGNGGLPGALLLEVLGSRKSVVFVEGDNGSHDVALYRALLPGYLVIPRGSCSQVIQSVRAFKGNDQLHHLQAFGLIDRDRRVEAEISKLAEDSIFVLDVAEVENLFCTQEVVKLVSEHLRRDPEADSAAVVKAVFSRLQSELEVQISLMVSSEVKFRLSRFTDGHKSETALSSAFASLVGGIDVATLHSEIKTKFQAVIESRDYEGLLRIYNRKSLCKDVSKVLGLSDNGLAEWVVRWAKSEDGHQIKDALKGHFGEFASHM
jgi:ABC-type branched-subunit amino acid transport system ATPase component